MKLFTIENTQNLFVFTLLLIACGRIGRKAFTCISTWKKNLFIWKNEIHPRNSDSRPRFPPPESTPGIPGTGPPPEFRGRACPRNSGSRPRSGAEAKIPPPAFRGLPPALMHSLFRNTLESFKTCPCRFVTFNFYLLYALYKKIFEIRWRFSNFPDCFFKVGTSMFFIFHTFSL